MLFHLFSVFNFGINGIYLERSLVIGAAFSSRDNSSLLQSRRVKKYCYIL